MFAGPFDFIAVASSEDETADLVADMGHSVLSPYMISTTRWLAAVDAADRWLVHFPEVDSGGLGGGVDGGGGCAGF
jgi:hypothetical protein